MTARKPKAVAAAPARPYVGRFAPTPSGPLHLGSLATALASYADAKHAHGKWLLRIEDADEHRSVRGAQDSILRTLTRYGFVPDGEIKVQSERKALYRSALEQLKALEKVYVCKCSRKSLEGEDRNISGEALYPGRCAGRNFVDFGHVSRRFSVGSQIIQWRDILFGVDTQDLTKDVGDFVVRRTDGIFTYQLAVVVDDAEQGVTRVVRGADLITSTARQIALQHALGLVTPEYLHIPVLVNGRGEKLSKSSLAAALSLDNPAPTLLSVWIHLGQAAPTTNYTDPTDFLKFAAETWDISKLPKAHTVSYRIVG